MTKSNVVRERRNSMELHRKYDLQAGQIAACVKAHDVPTAAIEFAVDGRPMGFNTVRNVITRFNKRLEKEGIPHETNKASSIHRRALYDSDKGYFEGVFRAILEHIKRQEDKFSIVAAQSAHKDEAIELLQWKIAELQANPKVEIEDTLMQELLREIEKK